MGFRKEMIVLSSEIGKSMENVWQQQDMALWFEIDVVLRRRGIRSTSVLGMDRKWDHFEWILFELLPPSEEVTVAEFLRAVVFTLN